VNHLPWLLALAVPVDHLARQQGLLAEHLLLKEAPPHWLRLLVALVEKDALGTGLLSAIRV